MEWLNNNSIIGEADDAFLQQEMSSCEELALNTTSDTEQGKQQCHDAPYLWLIHALCADDVKTEYLTGYDQMTVQQLGCCTSNVHEPNWKEFLAFKWSDPNNNPSSVNSKHFQR